MHGQAHDLARLGVGDWQAAWRRIGRIDVLAVDRDRVIDGGRDLVALQVGDQAVAVARRLETGTVWINQNLVLRPDTPFAGHKQSGIGVENGMDGMLEYMVPQSIYVPL